MIDHNALGRIVILGEYPRCVEINGSHSSASLTMYHISTSTLTATTTIIPKMVLSLIVFLVMDNNIDGADLFITGGVVDIVLIEFPMLIRVSE